MYECVYIHDRVLAGNTQYLVVSILTSYYKIYNFIKLYCDFNFAQACNYNDSKVSDVANHAVPCFTCWYSYVILSRGFNVLLNR